MYLTQLMIQRLKNGESVIMLFAGGVSNDMLLWSQSCLTDATRMCAVASENVSHIPQSSLQSSVSQGNKLRLPLC